MASFPKISEGNCTRKKARPVLSGDSSESITGGQRGIPSWYPGAGKLMCGAH